MASSVIGALSVEISVDAKGVKKGIEASGKALAIGGKQLRSSANKWGKWATAAVAATTAVTSAVVKTQMAALDSLAKTSDALGIQQEKLQALQHIGELTGTSNEQVNKSLERMQKNLGNAARNGGASADALSDLGVNVNEIIKLKPDEQMEQLAIALSGIDNQAERASISNDLFGRSGVRMLKMLDQLKDEGLDPTVKAIDSMGISLSRMETTKVENANDALFKAQEVVTGLANKLTVKLSPIIEAISNQFIDAAVETEGFGGTIDTVFDGVLKVIGVFADGLHGVQLAFKTLEAGAVGFAALAVKVFQGVTNIIATSIDGWVMLVNEGVKGINSVFDTGLKEIPTVRGSEFVASVDAVAANMVGLVKETNGELHELAMQELPSDQIRNFADAAIAEADRIATATVAKAETKQADQSANATDPAEGAEERRIREENEGILAALIEQGELKEETMLGRFAREEEVLRAALENKKITEEQYAAASVALAEKTEKGKLAVVTSSLDAAVTALSLGGKKAQKIQKNLAIVNAVIKGKEAAVAAWSAGMATGGPFAPAVAATYAAASIAQTAGMINSIKAGGKSMGGSSAGGGGARGASAGGSAGGSSSSENVPESRNISINLTGEGLMSTDQVRALIGQINESVGDGVQLITSGES